MRIWNVPVHLMCDKHLRGEHVETHMFVGSLEAGKSVQGFIDDGLFDGELLELRHEVVAREMVARGGKHQSPLVLTQAAIKALALLPPGRIDVAANIRELARRCPDCYDRIKAEGHDLGFPRGGDKVLQLETDGDWYVQLTGQILTDTTYPTRDKALAALEKVRRNMTLKRQGRL